MGLIIAAPRSGSGKTLLSLCLTAALRQRGLTVQTFKVGPDYLDSQLLGALSGRPCRNLDPLLCGEPWLRAAFHHWGRTTDACLVEGVMGLYDGLGPSQEGSTAHVARLLDLPLLFVVDAARQGASIRALVAGFREQASELPWCGVVLNGVGSLRHQQLLTAALEPTGLPVLGCLPRCGAMALPSRHLGLLPPAEIHHFQGRRQQLADLAERQLDVSRLLPRLQASRGAPGPSPFLATSPTDAPPRPRSSGAPGPLLAIAQDQAFCFLYPEQREWLEHWGARTQGWSPLADQPLPEGTAALVLPGGYPELHGATLAQATRSLRALQAAHGRGLPIYAECGGMLLLLRTLHDPDNRPWPMAGILPGAACRGAFQLGYRRALACGSSPVVRPHEQMVGHEFHHWQVAPAHTPPHPGAKPTRPLHPLWRLSGWGVPTRSEGLANGRLHASWLHLHWSGQPQVPRRLVAAARRAQEPGIRSRRNNT
ncbi:MAG: cobyrinate a,c-diamide synthase [Cyanobacteria bacterium MAG IRC4_bin_6]|nr:cobyrinate a,c-diamide synthase [Cyanobacteria bacterium MAG IRC3_bin_20]MDE0647550.1 cobyrinate a,c-diamide synthase [Cyanobacteria bacterium MAG IRC4_bin_6]